MSKEKKSREGKKEHQVLKSGSFIWTSGSKYDGEYKEVDDVIYRHGIGTYFCSVTNTTYTGQWDMDKMSGKGKIHFSSDAFYEVLFGIN